MIYLVEDDDNIRKLVSYALAKDGYEVCGCSCPHEFRDSIAKTLPELVLLDIMLPEEDGLSILKKLRSAKATENVPVIMLTAKSSEYDKVTGLDMGADDYIAKPFGMTELLSRVRALLRRANRSEKKGKGIPHSKPLCKPGEARGYGGRRRGKSLIQRIYAAYHTY